MRRATNVSDGWKQRECWYSGLSPFTFLFLCNPSLWDGAAHIQGYCIPYLILSDGTFRNTQMCDLLPLSSQPICFTNLPRHSSIQSSWQSWTTRARLAWHKANSSLLLGLSGSKETQDKRLRYLLTSQSGCWPPGYLSIASTCYRVLTLSTSHHPHPYPKPLLRFTSERYFSPPSFFSHVLSRSLLSWFFSFKWMVCTVNKMFHWGTRKNQELRLFLREKGLYQYMASLSPHVKDQIAHRSTQGTFKRPVTASQCQARVSLIPSWIS